MPQVLNAQETSEPNWITAKVTNNKRMYVCLAVLLLGMPLSMLTLSASKVGVEFFFVIVLLLMVGFFVGIIKWATQLMGVRLIPNGIEERTNATGIVRELKFSEFEEFAFMKDNRGNYWIRIKLSGGGPMIRYTPPSIRVVKRQPFLDFGSQLQRAVTAFNAGTSEPSHALLETPIVAKPIKTGLSKPEKVLNKGVKVVRIIYLIVVLFIGLMYIIAQPHPLQTLGYIALGGGVLFGLAWMIKMNNKKKNQQKQGSN